MMFTSYKVLQYIGWNSLPENWGAILEIIKANLLSAHYCAWYLLQILSYIDKKLVEKQKQTLWAINYTDVDIAYVFTHINRIQIRVTSWEIAPYQV